MKRFRLYHPATASFPRVEVEWHGHTRTWSGVSATKAIENARAAGITGKLIAIECDAAGVQMGAA